jgi:2-oxoisovalerate dehydrogenase E1 component alpha subunit
MKGRGEARVAITYFGDGTTSEGDFPSALNIAAVHGCPTIFFCRNNGYAISTSTKDQYASDGVAPRGPAYGLPSIRVDGNDLLAVVAATQRARAIALGEGRPVLIEAMTYRIGAHSTSDDDSKYRNPTSPEEGWDSERAYWEARAPIIRFGRWMHAKGWWSPQMEEDLRKACRKQAVESLNVASTAPKPATPQLFSDVYDELPWSLREQQAELEAHMRRYPEHYAQWLQG